MRLLALTAVVLVAACDTGQAVDQSPSPMRPSPAAIACKMPVYWADTATNSTLAAFVTLPSGTVSMAGTIRPVRQFLFGATYDTASRGWLPLTESYLSPDHKRYAYEVIGTTSGSQVHIVDIASGVDRVAYDGPTTLTVIAFESDGVYLRQAVNPKQGVYKELFRLDPAGGPPTLVRGSNRHMYQTGWTVVGAGAAWGLDFRVKGSSYTYLVERLDLASGAVAEWLASPPDHQFAPMGVDAKNRLYVTDGYEVWRLSSPGQVEHLLNPPKTAGAWTFGGVMRSDSHGTWFEALGGVWFHSDAQGSRQFVVGVPEQQIFPAGACF
jgi:hypothetical protein